MFSGARSWQVVIDQPEDLHLALYVRQATGLLSLDPAPLLQPPTSGAQAPLVSPDGWQLWWRHLLNLHAEAAVREDRTARDMSQRLQELRQHRAAAGAPPDFAALDRWPGLRQAAADAWHAGFRSWWETPPTAQSRGSRSSGSARVPVGGVRGDLIRATSEIGTLPTSVINAVGAPSRTPASFTMHLLAVEGTTASLIDPHYALVSVGLTRDTARFRRWLTSVLSAAA